MTDPFLPTWHDRIDWPKRVGSIRATEVLRGPQETEFSVVLASASIDPSNGDLRKLWKERARGTANPMLVVVTYESGDGSVASILGPFEDDQPAHGADSALVAQLVYDALKATSHVSLVRDLRNRIGTLTNGVAAGLRNEGLFAFHVLDLQPEEQPTWGELSARGSALRSLRGHDLLGQLGYEVEPVPDGEILLEMAGRRRRAAVVLLRDGESFDNPLNRLSNATAVAHGLLLAEREEVPWLIVLGGSAIRLYPVDPDIGVGRKGQTQTFLELDLALLPNERAGFLPLIFSPDGLVTNGAVRELLSKSSDFAADLASRLRERIYEGVVPPLARAVAARMGVATAPPAERRSLLDEAYHRAMIVLFRLLFVAYAEDRRLLPYGVSEAYTRNALKTIAKDLAVRANGDFDPQATTLWDDLVQVWRVIDTGDVKDWGVPAYNGGLFTRDPAKNASGAETYSLELTNDILGPVLRMLLVDETPEGTPGPVDFRSLSVREFGTIYEGLLESGLDIAEVDLAVGADDLFVPSKKSDAVVVRKGEVYFHSRSGSRKATGSYFTKPFAVEHLLDHALEPALSLHLDGVRSLLDFDQRKIAARKLFDFRVADLSMGSAHFLVSAIDRIEARFSRFLAEHPMAEIFEELNSLRSMAASQMGVGPDEAALDDGMLLRRQIARRCIYGVDLNEIAVELARLAVWIHTFVPGLPLSFLNHGLVWGNSLTGVGTLTEIEGALFEAEKRETKSKQDGPSLYLPGALAAFLDRAASQLEQLAALSDASIADVGRAAEVQAGLENSLKPLRDLCDLITAERTTRSLKVKDPAKVLLASGASAIAASVTADELEDAVGRHPSIEAARQVARETQAIHLPVAFPEVFRRENPGFDVIIGNPPWEKLKIEEDKWWSARIPGLLSMPQEEKNATLATHRAEHPELVELLEREVRAVKAASAALVAGPYPGIGATDIELAAAFCWRFWHEVRQHGRIGVVLPRTALSGSAAEQWRRAILAGGEFADVTTLTNTARWAFEMEPRYTIGLVSVAKTDSGGGAWLRGPFASRSEFDAGAAESESRAHVTSAELLAWSERAAIPLIPIAELDVFAMMRRHPSLGADIGTWHLRPYRELDTTKQKAFFDFNLDSPRTDHDLPVLTGESFNLWDPNYGAPYAFANSVEITALLQERRRNQIGLRSSAFYGLSESWAADPSTLPMRSPRVAFRDVARATDSRTMICALIPGGIALVHKAPYLVRQAGTEKDEAYVLGVLSSLPFDWFTRRFVELTMSFELLNSFPVPRVDESTGNPLGPDGSPVASESDLRPLVQRVIEIAGRLAAVDKRFADWANAVGVGVGTVKTQAEKDDLVAELDALVSLLYGLTLAQVEKVFATFHRGWDYKVRLAAVRKHYTSWKKKVSR